MIKRNVKIVLSHDKKHSDVKPPSIKGEEAVSGDNPDPSSDDDTLKNAHEVGEQLEEDPEHPKPVALDRDVDKAEDYKRTH